MAVAKYKSAINTNNIVSSSDLNSVVVICKVVNNSLNKTNNSQLLVEPDDFIQKQNFDFVCLKYDFQSRSF